MSWVHRRHDESDTKRPPRNRSRALGAVAIVFSLQVPANAQPRPCDPHASELNRVTAYLEAKNYTAAKPIVDRVLRSDPMDFRANYQRGTILVALADGPTGEPRTGLRSQFESGQGVLDATARMLPRQDPTCAKAKGFYTIYNAIGWNYLHWRQYRDAERYLLQGKAAKDHLSSDDYVRVLNNLGYTLLKENRAKDSVAILKEGKSLGSSVSANLLDIAQALATPAKR